MNTRNLRKRRKGYAAVVYVPKELQRLAAQRFGNGTAKLVKEIVRGLDTRDLREANRRKIGVIAEIQAELAALGGEDYTREALRIAEANRENPPKTAGDEDGGNDALIDMADRIAARHGVGAGKRFYEIARGKALPVSVALAQWKEAATGIRPGTMYQYERDILAFIEWSDDIAVQHVDERVAADWWNHLKATPTAHKRPIAPNTLNRKVGSLARLWKWMKARKVYTGANPWPDLLADVPGEAKRGSVVKPLRASDKEETQTYIKALAESRSPYKQAGHDVVVLLWHTGIRPGDICELTTDKLLWDEEDAVCWVTITKGKTRANARVMPVVSKEALAILKRRQEGAKDTALFHEVSAEGKDNKRYTHLQRRINPIRRRVLPDAPIDTYSGRRSFSNACEDAGLDPVQWSRMMGHNAPTLAAAVYNRGHEARKLLLEGIKKVEAELGELTADQQNDHKGYIQPEISPFGCRKRCCISMI